MYIYIDIYIYTGVYTYIYIYTIPFVDGSMERLMVHPQVLASGDPWPSAARRSASETQRHWSLLAVQKVKDRSRSYWSEKPMYHNMDKYIEIMIMIVVIVIITVNRH